MDRLAKSLESILTKNLGQEFDLDQLAHKLNRVNELQKDEIAFAMGALVRCQKASLILRVLSPSTQAKVLDVKKLDEVPSTLIDPATKEVFTVRTENLRIFYTSFQST